MTKDKETLELAKHAIGVFDSISSDCDEYIMALEAVIEFAEEQGFGGCPRPLPPKVGRINQ